MRSLNLDQLRALMEVTELGSFSAAARQLNLTQPAVSLQVRELEQRFGIRLVERLGRTVRPTAPGRELVEHASRILRECELATSAMRRFRDGRIGRVHIGATNTALTYCLPSLLCRLRQDHPGIELVVTSLPTRDTVEGIIQSKLDLGLVTLPVDETHLHVTPLRYETLLAILPAGMPDIPDTITPAWAARQALVLEHPRAAVHALVMRWLAQHQPLECTPLQLPSVEAMKDAVGMGFGMSFVPSIATRDLPPGVVARPLDPPAPCTLALAEHRNRRSEMAFQIVRTALLELREPPCATQPAHNGHPPLPAPAPVVPDAPPAHLAAAVAASRRRSPGLSPAPRTRGHPA